jgi:hypothetical protein
MEQAISPVLINKEVIPNLSFTKTTSDIPQEKDLQRKISDAMLLGNSYHTKVSIVFFDDEGPKKVNTTIWANGNKYICLKGGVWLPVSNIIEITLI